MAELFDERSDIPYDRSSVRLGEGEQLGMQRLQEVLESAGRPGRRWAEVWPPILESTVITRSNLGRIANDLRKRGVIDAPGWPSERHQIPTDSQVLRLTEGSR